MQELLEKAKKVATEQLLLALCLERIVDERFSMWMFILLTFCRDCSLRFSIDDCHPRGVGSKELWVSLVWPVLEECLKKVKSFNAQVWSSESSNLEGSELIEFKREDMANSLWSFATLLAKKLRHQCKSEANLYFTVLT